MGGRCSWAMGCYRVALWSSHLRHTRQNIHSRTATSPSFHPQGSQPCCTSVSGSRFLHTLVLHWWVWGCHTSCSASSGRHYKSCYSCPKSSRGPSYHLLGMGHCCKNQFGCHCLHTACRHAEGRGLHRDVSSVWSRLHMTHCMRPNSPTKTTSHPRDRSSLCTLVSVCHCLHTVVRQRPEGGCYTV